MNFLPETAQQLCMCQSWDFMLCSCSFCVSSSTVNASFRSCLFAKISTTASIRSSWLKTDCNSDCTKDGTVSDVKSKAHFASNRRFTVTLGWCVRQAKVEQLWDHCSTVKYFWIPLTFSDDHIVVVMTGLVQLTPDLHSLTTFTTKSKLPFLARIDFQSASHWSCTLLFMTDGFKTIQARVHGLDCLNSPQRDSVNCLVHPNASRRTSFGIKQGHK